ncbi:MAG: EAL domain-containing protein [Acidobacteriota bacterium]|nr:EAL domain-containing protein [Acidobacteriota bacterium]
MSGAPTISGLHTLLLRQLRKHFPVGEPETSADFIEAVNSAYYQFDDDRRMLERSLELSSQELIEANNELRAIFEALPDIVLRVDRTGRVLEMKSATARDPHGCLPPADDFLRAIGEVVQRKATTGIEYSIGSRDAMRHFEARLVPLPQRDELVVLIRDISDRKRAEEELKHSLSVLRSTFDSTAEGILVIDAAGRIASWNQRFTQMWRLPEDALEARDRARVLACAAEQLVNPQEFLDRVRELYGGDPLAESLDIIHFKDGRVLERYTIPQLLDGVPIGRISSFRDMTARYAAEQRLLHDAIHDGLTALPNRTLFMDRLGQAIRHSKRHLDHQFALLFVDVDRFKLVNDSLGHLVGDELLIAIAARVRDAVRPGDTVARLGGDEFTILLESIDKPEDTAIVAERIQQIISAPFRVREHEIFTTVSIGIAVSAPHYQTAEEMLRDADIAMYRAKANGRAGYEVFQPGMHSTAVALLQLENDLRRAVGRDELVLHYQPIVNLEDSRIIGFEALVRWNHPQRGLIYPAEFIPLAEETGLIVHVGRWALFEACARMAQWQETFGRPDLAMSVNLSGRQLAQPGFVADVERVLRETALPPETLCLEITETVLMENSDRAAASIGRLRDLGVKVHIDDFGTGYSSLSYLHRFAIDTLKIDRSFISHVTTGDESMEIIRTITTLAGNLKVPVIAEGVETEIQRAQLLALGCQSAQGYLFSMPADEAAVRTMIGSGRVPGTRPRMRERS